MTTAIQIVAPHFVAAIEVDFDEPGFVVVEAAPILRWMIGKPFAEVRDYCMRKRWHWIPVSDAGAASPAANH